jgi:hypothetical protein
MSLNPSPPVPVSRRWTQLGRAAPTLDVVPLDRVT